MRIRACMPHTSVRLVVSLAAGIAAGIVVAIAGPWQAAPAAGWGTTAAVYAGWVWLGVLWLDGAETSRFATREDPSRAVADSLVLFASVGSLGEVALLLSKAGGSSTTLRSIYVGSSVASVVMSWVLIHTVFTLHYARLYYGGRAGGVDFKQAEPPRYTDFAYLAFTIGMTFQVSDTDLQDSAIRSAALRHALLSFLFGVAIFATTINLIAGLTR
ncbi:MAG: DUF1345 domain-containing protein [Actinomycetota bacterium]